MTNTRSLVLPATPPPSANPEIAAIQRWVGDEFAALVLRLNEPAEVRLQVQHMAPERPRQGMVVFADGTDWDPGSGEGLYVYKSGGWTFII